MILLGMFLLAAGCARHAPVDSGHAAPAVAVEIVRLDTTSTGVLTLPARIRARDEVVVSARIAGRVTAILAREGESVRAGRPLARFDAPESRLSVDAARREMEAATLAAETAQRQHARIESLYAAHVVAARDRDLAASEKDAAEARLESARATVEALGAAVSVSAPFDGVVARRYVDRGTDVQPGEALFLVRSAGGIEVVVPVPEAALDAIRGARWWFQVGDGPWQAARLGPIDGMTDFTTRTRTAHLLPAAAVAADPGAFARVRIESSRLADRPLATLPAGSIVRRGALTGVYVIDGDRARLRWLRLGHAYGDQVEVLSGLLPGDAVARSPAGLADGAAVKVGG